MNAVSRASSHVILLDTNVVVASLYPAHPWHTWASQQRQQPGQLVLSAHSLAEVYKVMTGHPHIRLAPERAASLLATVAQQVRVIALTEADYHAALARCAAHNLSGAVIFDALIAQAALKAGAQALATLNPKDFRRLGDDVQAILVSP